MLGPTKNNSQNQQRDIENVDHLFRHILNKNMQVRPSQNILRINTDNCFSPES